MALYASKSGSTMEIEEDIDPETGIDKARDEAMKKGWKPQIEVVSPKSGKAIHIDQDSMDEAKIKGWLPKHEYEAKNTYQGDIGKGTSALLGATQSGSLGFADEVYGALKGGYERLKKGEDTSLGEEYKRARDEARSVYSAAEKQNPKSYLGGGIAGGFVTPGGVGKSIGGAALRGAGLGAATSLGSSDVDLTDKSLGDAAMTAAGEAGTGAAIGGALGGGFAGASKALKVLPGALERKSANEAQRSLRLTEKELSKIPKSQQEQMGSTLQEYLGPTGAVNAKQIGRDLALKGQAVGEAKKGIGKAYGEKEIVMDNVTQKLRAKADELSQSGAKDELAAVYANMADILEKKGAKESVESRLKRIADFQERAYDAKSLTLSDADKKKALRDVRELLKNDMIEQIEKNVPEGASATAQLKAADADFKKLKDLDKVLHRVKKREELEGGLSRITAGVTMGTIGGIGAGAGAYAGGAEGSAVGTAMSLLGHLAMKRKNPLAAYYSKKASQILGSKITQESRKLLEAAAQKGIVPFMQELDKHREAGE